jgi:hypothetical protein
MFAASCITARSESLPMTIPTFDVFTFLLDTFFALANSTSFILRTLEIIRTDDHIRTALYGMDSILLKAFRQDLQDKQDFFTVSG